MTIEELKAADDDIKQSWKEYFMAELFDYEGADYLMPFWHMSIDSILDTFITQGYWAGIKRRYYWSPAMLTFVTEGR